MSAVRKLQETVFVDKEIEFMLNEFLTGRQRDLTEIEKSLEDGNWHNVKRIGHILSGVAGGFGFDDLGEIGREIESLSQTREGEKILLLVGLVRMHLRNVKIVLK